MMLVALLISFNTFATEEDLNICKKYAKFAHKIMEGRAKGVIMADVYNGNHIEKEIVERAYDYFTSPLSEVPFKGVASEFSDKYFKSCLQHIKKKSAKR